MKASTGKKAWTILTALVLIPGLGASRAWAWGSATPTCMDDRINREHDHIPFLNLAYDGQEQTHTRTRLEAFMYQVRQFHNRSHPKRPK